MTQTPSLKTQTLQVSGMDCGSCAKTIEASLRQMHGISQASVSFATGKVRVSYNSEQVSQTTISDRIKALGYTVEQSPSTSSHHHTHDCCHDRDDDPHDDRQHDRADVASTTKTLQVRVGGMDCGSCAKTLEVGRQQISGVVSALVSFATERLQVVYDSQQVSETAISERVKALGYTMEQTTEASSECHTQCSSHDRDWEHTHDRDRPAFQPTQNPNLTNWRFWITNRRGQNVILAGVGIVMGLLAQNLGLPVWIARAFYGIGKVSPKSQ
ncbi:hypothetical protein C7B80_03840 [Cyanosarcina cf. burmensis CCALA 770]|nr:hypothetical protein C7B80_03840 [Cyanosarcina cf. burmensis CCALA 770]